MNLTQECPEEKRFEDCLISKPHGSRTSVETWPMCSDAICCSKTL